MNDLISRQLALDAITAIDEGDNIDISTNEVRGLLRELPSAEPFVIRMKRFVKADERERFEKELYRKMTQQSLIFLEPDMELVYPTIEPEQRWIPVTERLPEEDGLYITTTMYGDVYCDYWKHCNFDRAETVIAWMPLPEPYKEKE